MTKNENKTNDVSLFPSILMPNIDTIILFYSFFDVILSAILLGTCIVEGVEILNITVFISIILVCSVIPFGVWKMYIWVQILESEWLHSIINDEKEKMEK